MSTKLSYPAKYVFSLVGATGIIFTTMMYAMQWNLDSRPAEAGWIKTSISRSQEFPEVQALIKKYGCDGTITMGELNIIDEKLDELERANVLKTLDCK